MHVNSRRAHCKTRAGVFQTGVVSVGKLAQSQLSEVTIIFLEGLRNTMKTLSHGSRHVIVEVFVKTD
jgi:hypothetical protein